LVTLFCRVGIASYPLANLIPRTAVSQQFKYSADFLAAILLQPKAQGFELDLGVIPGSVIGRINESLGLQYISEILKRDCQPFSFSIRPSFQVLSIPFRLRQNTIPRSHSEIVLVVVPQGVNRPLRQLRNAPDVIKPKPGNPA
jgi:hypothetical protein